MTLQAKIYEANSTTYTQSVYQHDKNVTLVFDGLDLPEKYEVHFSNQKDSGISVSCEGTKSGVLIPDALLSTGEYVYVWVCDSNEQTGTNVQYMVVIPVIPRPVPIPVQTASEDSGEFGYAIDEDEEDLSFFGTPNGMLRPNIEEDN